MSGARLRLGDDQESWVAAHDRPGGLEELKDAHETCFVGSGTASSGVHARIGASRERIVVSHVRIVLAPASVEVGHGPSIVADGSVIVALAFIGAARESFVVSRAPVVVGHARTVTGLARFVVAHAITSAEGSGREGVDSRGSDRNPLPSASRPDSGAADLGAAPRLLPFVVGDDDWHAVCTHM
ncbi:MAG TPA: hypothetical protein VFF73_09735 [Planctomycetota bacterium]|nr:hypothetical protein [Planctomycetota bacterium]